MISSSRYAKGRFVPHSKRSLNGGPSYPERVSEDDGTNIASDQKKRNHVMNLRSITAKLLREESQVRTASFEDCPSKNVDNMNKSGRNSIKFVKSSNTSEPFPKLKPWVESSGIEEEMQWAQASPTEALTPQQQSDSVTEHTTLCSVFEMLSFENICSGGQKSVVVAEGYLSPLKVVGVAPAEDDEHMVPREITIENHDFWDSCTGGVECPKGMLCVEKPQVLPGHRLFKKTRSLLMKRLYFRPSKVDKSTRVMKVKVYVDPPKRSNSNNSISNSTLTYPKELQRNNTLPTI